MNCDNCNTDIGTDISTFNSMVVVLQKVSNEGKDGYLFFQCEDGQTNNYIRYQHFNCSKECMHTSVVDCINEHHTEDKLHPIPTGMGSTILHKIVLGEGLKCKVCGNSLSNCAYRFCITRATPYNEVIDDSHNQLGEWCCSLEHAKQNGVNNVKQLVIH